MRTSHILSLLVTSLNMHLGQLSDLKLAKLRGNLRTQPPPTLNLEPFQHLHCLQLSSLVFPQSRAKTENRNSASLYILVLSPPSYCFTGQNSGENYKVQNAEQLIRPTNTMKYI